MSQSLWRKSLKAWLSWAATQGHGTRTRECAAGTNGTRDRYTRFIRAHLILDELRRQGVTHVLTLPDNASKALLDLLAVDPAIRLLTVTREGEAFAIASGLWVGGRVPVVLIQNTGLLETGDALRGTAMRMRVPLVCLVTYRGHATLAAAGVAPSAEAMTGALLGRADVDSVALLTEPTLRAWGVPWEVVSSDADVARIARVFEQARALEQPVAALITRETTA
jgi:sulfopyruvate decarboxylase subunit alpha